MSPARDASRVRLHCWVAGKVQGVSYRASTQQHAGKLALRGWVRNLADGRVECVLEGPGERVEQMVAWLRKGPPLARVSEVRTEHEAEEGLRGFEVRR
ncbi:MAG: acylphosphatase [Halobacteriales archaeon]|nr:acylphosphatase [Halobacteriales archaeon]